MQRLAAVLTGLRGTDARPSSLPAASVSAEPEYRSPAHADMLPELSAPGATPERLKFFHDHGFVIIDDFVGSPWIETLREAGRRVTEGTAPDHGYDVVDGSKGYVHRAGQAEEPWAIRGLIHPAWNEPSFAEFHGSSELTGFIESWTDGAWSSKCTNNVMGVRWSRGVFLRDGLCFCRG